MTRLQALGVDLGTTRVRVAMSEITMEKKTRLRAIASRDLPDPDWSHGGRALDFAAMIVEQLVRELGLRKKECVTALGCPSATLRTVAFPKMGWRERRHAARFEVAWSPPNVLRVHPVDRRTGLFAVATVDARVMKRQNELLRKAGLRLIAIDHDAYALGRALPGYDAVADIGYETMRLHVVAGGSAYSWHAEAGGNSVTQAIAADLGLDAESAERRKRILGTTGAGASSLGACARELCALLDRASGYRNVRSVALVGNGARLPGLATEIAERTRLRVDVPVAEALLDGGFSDEVLQVAAPDWTLAAALSGWQAA
jgi:Tfp pilus assembly PilM family ATPase